MSRFFNNPICTFFVAVFSLCLTGCRENFDEYNDTDQRNLLFLLDSSTYFDSVLVGNGEGEYHLGMPFELQSDYLLRVVGYCYNLQGELMQREELISANGENLAIEFRHLQCEREYRFVFIADIVKYYPGMGYLETWYQLDTHEYEHLYLHSIERDAAPQNNHLLFKELVAIPQNQTLNLALEPFTYNGYLSFSNTSNIHSIKLEVKVYQDVKVSGGKMKNQVRTIYHYNQRGDFTSFCVPVTCSRLDDELQVSLTLEEFDAEPVKYDIAIPMKQKPFTVEFDCEKITYVLCEEY